MDEHQVELLPPDIEELLASCRSIPNLPGGARDRVDLRRENQTSRTGRRPRAQRRRWSSLAVGGAATLVAVAVIALFLTRSEENTQRSGLATTTTRRTVDIGGRAVAVAESGAELRWRVAHNGEARIDQSRGNVFYRVDSGGHFYVHTSVGTVSVTGTSFRVHYRPGRDSVSVRVYEGSVIFANEFGQQELRAGEQADAQQGSAPSAAFDFIVNAFSVISTSGTEISSESLQLRIEQLQQRVRELELGAGAHKGSDEVDPRRAYYRPTQEDLKSMAANCRLKFDIPPLDAHGEPALIDRLEAIARTEFDLSRAERDAIKTMYARFNRQFSKQMRDLYIEATGDIAGATVLSLDSMGAEITSKSDPQAAVEARRKVAEGRAGLRARPGDEQLPIERYYRLMVSLGGNLERELAQIVGAERAAAIRHATNGWPAKTSAGSCEP